MQINYANKVKKVKLTFQQLSNQSYKQIDVLINMLFYGDQRDRDIEPFVFDWNN